MAKVYRITVDDAGDRAQPVIAGELNESCARLSSVFKDLGSGHMSGVTLSGGISGARATGSVALADAEGTLTVTVNGVAIETDCPASSGTVTVSGAAGTLTVTIAGEPVEVEFNTDDDTTADDIATAIGATLALDGVVTATAAANVVTITSVELGAPGDAITLAVSGTGLTRSGTTLTGGDDEACAAAVVAEAQAVTTALVAKHVTFARDGSDIVITAVLPGHAGNAVTLAATGTGATASGARLTGGTETQFSWSF